MRFLFVYQDFAEQARKLLLELAVVDVELIVARKNASGPTEKEIALLSKHPGAEAAACELNRKYRKLAGQYVTFCVEPKKFRFEDQQLREWLVPAGHTPIVYDKPSVAFRAAAARVTQLVLHPDALSEADDTAEHRWRFIAQGADLLARYADGEELAPNREWKATYGVDFAANGRVSFRYTGACGEQACKGRTEWHIKEGDNTTRESAARVYFARVRHSGGTRVVVFHVGPHPEDGERVVSFDPT